MTPTLAGRSVDEVTASILDTHRQICTLHSRLLMDIAEQDLLGHWSHQGAKSEEDYLAVALGLEWRTAKTWVRLGHALHAHPDLAERYRRGQISADQLGSIVDALAVKLAGAVGPVGPLDGPTEPSEGGTDHSGDQSGVADDPHGDIAGDGGAGDGPRNEEPEAPCPDGESSAASGTDPVGSGSGLAGESEGSSDTSGTGAAAALDELLDLAGRLTPAQLASMARRLRRRSQEEAGAARRRRRIQATPDLADTRLHLEGDLFDEASATVWAALTDYANNAGRDPVTGLFDPLQVRFADALEAMAIAYLEKRSGHVHRPTIVFHADVSVLAGEDGWAHAVTGSVCAETIRRLACHAGIWLSVDDASGNPLWMGRAQRDPSWQQVEACRRRDGGCRFPGCEQLLWTHCHHIAQWERDRGRTDLTNLVTLCTRHHHLVHEGGWKVSGDPGATLTFTSPDGRTTLPSCAVPQPPSTGWRRAGASDSAPERHTADSDAEVTAPGSRRPHVGTGPVGDEPVRRQPAHRRPFRPDGADRPPDPEGRPDLKDRGSLCPDVLRRGDRNCVPLQPTFEGMTQ